MPVYEYFCNDCRAVFEVLRPMADRDRDAACPLCESRSSTPLMSRVSVRAAGAAYEAASGGGGGGGCACGGACSCAN